MKAIVQQLAEYRTTYLLLYLPRSSEEGMEVMLVKALMGMAEAVFEETQERAALLAELRGESPAEAIRAMRFEDE